MRATLVVLVFLLWSQPADAMGLDITFDLVAWNGDGSSALLLRDAGDAEGNADVHYVVVSATGERFEVEISTSVTGDPQGTDRASCTKALRDLKRALEADHFDGV